MREIEAKIRRYNADLPPSSPTFKAAVLLFCGLEFGHNIDALSRRTSYERPFVARIARRLIDNGVWKCGVTVADWSSSDEASGTFWNDVAVAEGKMCRRIGPDGRIEWAPAGFWNKSFHFVDPEADQKLAAVYFDSGRAGTEESVNGAVERLDTVAAQPSAAEPEPLLVDEAEEHLSPEPTETVPETVTGRRESGVPRLDELFRDVVWIG